MSFHISFVARSVADARAKLHEQGAPEAVKALIEKALDAIPLPVPQMLAPADARNAASAGVATSSPRYATGFFGVSVEASGHISNPGDGHAHSNISRFEVKPLVA